MSTSVVPDPEVARKAREYWELDGIPTLFRGVAWLMWTAFFIGAGFSLRAYVKYIPNGILIAYFGSAAILFLFAWLSSHVPSLIQKIKERITYPRTGYVAPPELWERLRKPDVGIPKRLGQFVLRWGWLGLIFIPHFQMRAWMLVVAGVTIGLVRAGTLKNQIFSWVEIFGYPLCGVLAALLFPNHINISVAVTWLAPGVLLTLRGVLVLLRYQRRNPLPQP